MSRSTGPILVAGAITWSNRVLLENDAEVEDRFTETIRIGVATGLLAALFYGFEKFVGEIAVGIAWVALATTVLVRYKDRPTPLERVLDLVA